MPYEKNKTTYQDEVWFKRAKKHSLNDLSQPKPCLTTEGITAYIVVFGSVAKMIAWDKNTPNELMGADL